MKVVRFFDKTYISSLLLLMFLAVAQWANAYTYTYCGSIPTTSAAQTVTLGDGTSVNVTTSLISTTIGPSIGSLRGNYSTSPNSTWFNMSNSSTNTRFRFSKSIQNAKILAMLPAGCTLSIIATNTTRPSPSTALTFDVGPDAFTVTGGNMMSNNHTWTTEAVYLALGTYSYDQIDIYPVSGAASVQLSLCNAYSSTTVPPIVTASAATGISSFKATLNGNITSLGGPATVTDYGFYYSTSSNPSSGGTKVQVGTSGSVASFQSVLSGLSSNTTYYVCSYATNSSGTSYSSVNNFTTSIIDLYSNTNLQAGFATLKGAFDAINAGTYTGALELKVNGNTTETSSAVLNASNGSAPNYTSVMIYPTAAGITISGNLAAPLINLNGADNVTIDGRENATGNIPDLIIKNTSTSNAPGTTTIRFINNAANDTIRYCNLQGSSLDGSSGIISFRAPLYSTSSTGNSYNGIFYNKFTSADGNRPRNGIMHKCDTDYYTKNNTIANNVFFDLINMSGSFFNGGAIYLDYYIDTWTIRENSFYESQAIVAANSTMSFFIYIGSGGGNNIIDSNSIGGSGPDHSGTWAISGSPRFISAIYDNSLYSTISNNVIKNFSCNFSSPDQSYCRLIFGSNGSTIVNNTINTITINNNSTQSVSFECINLSETMEIPSTIDNNTIGDASVSNSIYCQGSPTAVQNMYGINVYNYGNSSDNIISITNNKVQNLVNDDADGNCYGIYSDGNGSHAINSISGNFINLPAKTGGVGNYYGLYKDNGVAIVSNNIFSLGAGSSINNTLYGIYDTGATSANNTLLYFNSVYLSGTPTGSTSSYALYSAATTNIRDYRNTLFINARAGGTGKHYAACFAYNSVVCLINDYNDFYVSGAVGTKVGYFNSTDYTTFTDFKAAMGQNANSLNLNPVFANGGGSYAMATDFRVGTPLSGTTIAGITTDYFGNTRSATPMIGAIEGNMSLLTVTTQAATAITAATATGNGRITDLGTQASVSDYGICYSSSNATPTTADSKVSKGATTTTGAFTAPMTGLTVGTTYYVRAYATNGTGTSYGSVITFTALNAPTVTTQAATATTTSTALGKGMITNLGIPASATDYGICYSSSNAMPTTADSKVSNGATTTTGAFTASITGLTAGTTYYVRAYATNSAGTSYGSVVSFTALNAPTVTTQAATAITAAAATGNGTIANLGIPASVTDYGICWSSSNTTPTTADSKASKGATITTGAFTAPMTGLTGGTTYYVRAYAINSTGTSYGSAVSFITANVDVYTGPTPVFQHSYPTLKAAFDAINAGTHTGILTLKINGSTTETATAVLNASNGSAPNYSSVMIYPTAELITISGNLAAPLIDLNGADNVTIKGESVVGGVLHHLIINNTSNSSVAGTSTIRFINDATNNIITDCELRGSTLATTGGIVFFSTGTSTGNSNNTVSHSRIGVPVGDRYSYPVIVSKALSSTYGFGIYSRGSAAGINSNNTISYNVIYNCYNIASTDAEIYLSSYNTAWTINDNQIYQTFERGNSASKTDYGIRIDCASGNGFTVSGNSVGGSQDFYMNFAPLYYYIWTEATPLVTTVYRGISLNVGTITQSTVRNNTILDFKFASSTNSGLNVFSGILISGGLINVVGNTIRNINTESGSTGTAANACLIGINNVSTNAQSIITQNTILNLYNSLYATASITGIYYAGSTTATADISRNFISRLWVEAVGMTGVTSSNLTGLYFNSGLANVTNNIICLGVIDPYCDGEYPLIYPYPAIHTGIRDVGSSNGTCMYFNTINICGTFSSALGTGNTYALYSSSTSTRAYKNNLFVNTRNNSNGGSNYGMYLTSKTGLTCDYNDYYVSGTGNYVGFYSSNRATLAAWQIALTSPYDINSKSIDPTFVNAGGNYMLATDHMVGSSLPGTTIAGFPTDFYFVPRTLPYIGAMEGSYNFITPTVETQAAMAITSTTATCNGTITSLGIPVSVTDYGICWGSCNSEPDITNSCISTVSKGATTNTGAFTVPITGLTAGTTYYARAYATNSAGTSYGSVVTFTALNAPTVTTQAATAITTTTATGNGTITDLGIPASVTDYGVCWSSSNATPTTSDSKAGKGATTTTGAFTASLTGLTAGTTYYVRAYATNSAGTSYGSVVTFTALNAPTVTTQAATAITTTTATGNGTITSLGIPASLTDYGICWSSSNATPTTSDSKAGKGATTTTGAFTASLTGLTPGTTYYVRAYAINSTGTSYGSVVTFTALNAPTVTTQAATTITTTTATGNGTITSLGIPVSVTDYGICWSSSNATPTTSDSKAGKGATTTTGAFTASLTGLTAGTTYYVRAYATNSTGTSYGSVVTFTALNAPTVTTQAATTITATTATGNGTITSLGIPASLTDYGICWSSSNATPTTADSKAGKGATTTTGAFTASLTGLTAGTTYYVRAYATNSAGTSYGSVVTFTALNAPTVTTQAATAITTTTATGNGTITSLGIPASLTDYGICWSSSNATPTTSDSKAGKGATTTTGAFTASLTGLTPGTTYYVRAYAINSTGTSYGSVVTFTALNAPTVTTQAATTITTTTATLRNGTITSLGIPVSVTDYGICWSSSNATPTTSDSKAGKGATTTTGAFTASLTGLTAGTTYYVRAYATNSAGTSYGSVVTFTALNAPTVTTQAATAITTTTATGNGTITSLGIPASLTDYGICWSSSNATPTTSDSKAGKGATTTTGAFTASLTGLTPGTTYYVRAYAINSTGTSYGSVVTFTALNAPTVTTQAATTITTTTATGNGTITSLGIPVSVTDYGICWSSSNATPTTADSKAGNGATLATGTFTSTITGLTAGTTYYVRAYAINSTGTSYGSVVTFTALNAPTVTTQAATTITATTATGNGTITSLGIPASVTDYGVCWSSSNATPTTADSKAGNGATLATGTFTSTITGLTAGTTYYVRAYAINSTGTSYGSVVTFTALNAPTVTTQAATTITTTTATGNGTITSLGIPVSLTDYGICWSSSNATPTTSDSKAGKGATTTTGAFTASLTGLTPGTTYYVRAYATNSAGTSYGSVVTFTALNAPTVTTQAATTITTTTATGNGTITSLGIPASLTDYGICWSSSSATPTTSDSKAGKGATTTTGAFTASLTGLTAGTTYYVRAYATNSAGTSYGSVVSFTTIANVDVYTGLIPAFQHGYATLKAAFDAINAGTHAGILTLKINNSTVETASAVINASNGSAPNYSSVTIYPTAADLVVTGNPAAPLIDLNGADNVTIDGRVNGVGRTADLTISNTNVGTAAGTSTIRFIADAAHNNITYCKLQGSTTDSEAGIIFFSTGTSTGNDNNTISNNAITASAGGRSYNGIRSVGTASKENSSNSVSSNNFFDLLHLSGGSSCINLGPNNTAWNISSNNFYETNTIAFAATGPGDFNIINVASGNGYTVDGNYIGGSGENCSGMWTKTANANVFCAINMWGCTSAKSDITNNTIKGFSWTNSAIDKNWYGIYSANADTIKNNTIGTISATEAIILTNGGSSSGSFYGIYAGSGSTVNGNNVSGITATNSVGYATNFFGIYLAGSFTKDSRIVNNTIGGIVDNSINCNSNSTGSEQIMRGIVAANSNTTGTTTIVNNTIQNLKNAGTYGEGCCLAAIHVSSQSTTISNNQIKNLSMAHNSGTGLSSAIKIESGIQTISGNTIDGLTNSSSGHIAGIDLATSTSSVSAIQKNFIYLQATSGTGRVYGINIASGANNVSNNIVHLGYGSTAQNTLCGIYDASGASTKLYFNTVCISGSLAFGATAKSYNLYGSNSGSMRDYRNNLFVNTRSTVGGSNLHYAVYLDYGSIVNLTLNSNNYYISGTGGVTGHYSSTDYSFLSLFKSATHLDIYSLSVDPKFATNLLAAVDYKPTVPTLIGDQDTGVNIDFGGNARTNYFCMGAWEALVNHANIWYGTTSADWGTASNWRTNVVPASGDNIQIADLPVNDCLLDQDRIVGDIINEQPTYRIKINGHKLAINGDLKFHNGGQIDALASASNLSFTGLSAQSIPSGAFYSDKVYNLSINNSNNVTLFGNLSLAGSLECISGRLDVTSQLATLIYAGSSVQTIEPNLFLNDRLYNLVINNTVGVVLNTSMEVGHNLVINSGRNLLVSPNMLLVVNGSILNNAGNAGLVVGSTADGTGSIIHYNSGVAATVNRYIETGNPDSHMLSTPVDAQNIGGSWTPTGTYGNGTGYDLVLFHEPKSCWLCSLNESIDPKWSAIHSEPYFVPGRGYLYSLQTAPATKSFLGNLNVGTVSSPVTVSEEAMLPGFNLIGNPYPCSIDWKINTGYERSILVDNNGGSDMWIWNPNANNFGVYNSSNELNGGTNEVTRYIPAMQSFFVNAASNGTFQFKNEARVALTENLTGTKWKSGVIPKEDLEYLKIRVTSNKDLGFDEINCLFDVSTDQNGALKMFSVNTAAPSLYVNNGGQKYSTIHLADSVGRRIFPVAFKPGLEGTYSISCKYTSSYIKSLYLLDLKTNTLVDMINTPQYTFTATEPELSDSWFKVYINTLPDDRNNFDVNVYVSSGNLVIDLGGVFRDYLADVYDVNGRYLVSKMMVNGSEIVRLSRYAHGIYMVKLYNSYESKVYKVIY